MADILIVDDEENLQYSLQLTLKRAGHQCRLAETLESAFAECVRKIPDLALVDLHLPDGSGIDLLARIRKQSLDVPVVVISAFGTIAKAVEAMKQGAVDFIQKPLSMEEVCLAVDRCMENRRLRNQLDAYQQAQRRESGDMRIVGECNAMTKVLSLAEKIASVPNEPGAGLATTLILGETGTGKEVIARYIHSRGPRSDRAFVQVNCTAIPQSLFESELFGHERGTFTDAKEAKKGLIEMAHEGVLFLDEIGDMPLSTQAKLLVAIESGRFRRLGGTAERMVDVQVLAATNSDLLHKISRGEFRKDLYYRLRMFSIELPPLRARGDDLFLLADHFIDKFCQKFHKGVPELPTATRQLMKRYSWPGNVRELAHVLQRAVLVNEAVSIEPQVLGIEGGGTPRFEDGGLKFDFTAGGCTLEAVERLLIHAALEHTGQNISETARLLGMTRGNLRHRIKKLAIDDNGEETSRQMLAPEKESDETGLN